ncbi:tetratricopeptide repeat protein [bacterium]|nr:tetratricopeptide repeat protein [bacterium]
MSSKSNIIEALEVAVVVLPVVIANPAATISVLGVLVGFKLAERLTESMAKRFAGSEERFADILQKSLSPTTKEITAESVEFSKDGINEIASEMGDIAKPGASERLRAEFVKRLILRSLSEQVAVDIANALVASFAAALAKILDGDAKAAAFLGDIQHQETKKLAEEIIDAINVVLAELGEIRGGVEEIRATGKRRSPLPLQPPYEEFPEGANPRLALVPMYGVVRFHGRDALIDELLDWCRSDAKLGLRVFHGPGGRGKTRLFRELCRRVATKDPDWHAGFFIEGSELDLDSFDDVRSALVVVDYADAKLSDVEHLGTVISRLRAKGYGGRIRVVLLARDAGTHGDWWENVRIGSWAPHIDSIGQCQAEEVSPLAPTPELQRDAYRHARIHFAKAFGGDTDVEEPDFERLHDENPYVSDRAQDALTLHILALNAVLGIAPASFNESIDRLLEHEYRYWKKLAGEPLWNRYGLQVFRLAKAFATLAVPPSQPRQPEILLRLKSFAETGKDSVAIARTIHERGMARLTPIEPDLVGERLIGSILKDKSSEAHIELLDATLSHDETRFSALTVLSRISELSGPVAYAIVPWLPERSIALTFFSADVTERAVKFARSTRPGDKINIARYVNVLGVRRSNLGQRLEALTAAEEAVVHFRDHAATNGDAFFSDLASALNNISVNYSDLGEREKALSVTDEAVTIYRKLAEKDRDVFLPRLAVVLSNLGNRYNDLGKTNQALVTMEESEGLFRELSKKNRDEFLPDLAMVLNNLGTILSGINRHVKALKVTEEAVEYYRILVKKNRDAFLPGLASALPNLCARYGHLDQLIEALKVADEAVEIYSDLARRNNDAYIVNLAQSRNNRAATLHRLDRNGEAVIAARQAVETLREPFLKFPQALKIKMKRYLSNYSNSTKLAGIEPDAELVGPIAEALMKLEEERGE